MYKWLHFCYLGGLYQMISVWLFFFNWYHASNCQLWLVVICWVGAYITSFLVQSVALVNELHLFCMKPQRELEIHLFQLRMLPWAMFQSLHCTMVNPFVAGSLILFTFIEIMEAICEKAFKRAFKSNGC